MLPRLDDSSRPGTVRDRYEVVSELATGGMATVYLGRLVGARGFSRTVAVKVMHPQYAKDRAFCDMFVDEARLSARIRHPNVVPIWRTSGMRAGGSARPSFARTGKRSRRSLVSISSP